MSVGVAALCLAACSSARYDRSAWDGRRGYDGNGDYGYDVAASRSEAGNYRANAARQYPAPGPADDPWGPYIGEAAMRYRVPERWIRAVMRQESGGNPYTSDGSLITSDVGAMGLMQVMPATYDILRQHEALGGDPYDPHDNILAGNAYIREMYNRFGAPAFLAAYNAGPDRVDAYLAGGAILPDETVNYLASVAPRLGDGVAMTGPLAVYAAPSASDRAYAVGGMSGSDYDAQRSPAPSVSVPANRPPPPVPNADLAYAGGGLVTDAAPTGQTEAPAASDAAYVAPAPAPARPTIAAAMLTPIAAPASPPEAWAIQVGAFADPAIARAAIAGSRVRAADLLTASQAAVIPVVRGTMLYRARLLGLSANAAVAACTELERDGVDCLTVPPGS